MISALVEAWEEVKVQKARVITSLIGVVAAVAAMSTVIALGDLMIQAQREQQEAWNGRNVTLTFTSYQTEDMADGSTDWIPPESSNVRERDHDFSVPITDPVGDAYEATMDRFEVPFWTRRSYHTLTFPDVQGAIYDGIFQGRAVKTSEDIWDPQVQISAVDPAYATIFRLQMNQGRWLTPSDANQLAVPLVINETLWKAIGEPDLNQPIMLTSKDEAEATFRIAGVVKQVDKWEGLRGYITYDSWNWIAKTVDPSATPELLVWMGEDENLERGESLQNALKAVLGSAYTVDMYGGELSESLDDSLESMKLAIMGIGGVVIALGAMGLLNVAIVTVRQRIREIGIRRAVGASSSRIFTAVFMESVVATFIAGVIGVALAIIIIRLGPWDMLGVDIQDNPPFPTTAALAGIGIATAIGALCGIIPAVLALKVRPIDAIRY